jgi:putative glutathione S-transferase
MRAIKGLEDCIPLSIVAPWTHGNGWSFAEYPGATHDGVNGFDYLYEVYLLQRPDYTGRVTVPVLWDTRTGAIVSSDSADILRMFNSEFDAYAGNEAPDFYPPHLRACIDATNERLYRDVNHGVYRAGFAATQAKYEEAVVDLFRALDELEALLGTRRYLCGARITEADWRLFTTLIRFDAVYYVHFKCNVRRLADYPNLLDFVRELYQWPGVAGTVNFDHIKHHYYRSHPRLNPGGIVPLGPYQDFDLPHRRGLFASRPAAEQDGDAIAMVPVEAGARPPPSFGGWRR